MNSKFWGGLFIVMKKNMIFVTILFLIGFLVSGAIYHLTRNEAFFSFTITCGTTFYHFAVRLAIGYFVDARYHNRMDYTKKWFMERAFEQKLYKKIQVKKWKKWFPTFNPQDFDLKSRSMTEIVQVTCQAEIVHEVNMVLSLVPIVFSVWFGSLGVFLLTSCIAFLFDGIFVIMQRYNRPRLIRLLRKQT